MAKTLKIGGKGKKFTKVEQLTFHFSVKSYFDVLAFPKIYYTKCHSPFNISLLV